MTARRLVLGGVTSGVGKTTVACGLMAAFRRRGLRVQPFKCGPDYIDPSHHSRAAARTSRNLDSVLLPPDTMRSLFARASARADLSIVEGMMGLFDGINGLDEGGSTAHIAKILDTPVVIVVDVARTSRSAGAIALGCVRFDPALRVAGFILNGVGGETHARWAREAVEGATGLPVFGAFPSMPDLALPERHLGLVPTGESAPDEEFFTRLAATTEEHVDLDRLWAASAASPLPSSTSDLFPPEPLPSSTRVAIAQDAAFNFYYEDSLDLLEAWGAELVPFSPLEDDALPEGSGGVYLGGGFPEVFASELAENTAMHQSLRCAAQAGLPIYGECGGLMYLGETLTDFEGTTHAMTGVIPFHSRMQRRYVTLGYRTAVARQRNILLQSGEGVRGHEFHYSEPASAVPEETAAYRLEEKGGALEGFAAGGVLASYVHLHFGSRPDLARRFVAACGAQP